MVKYTQIIGESMRLGLIGLILVGIFSISRFAFAEMSSVNYEIDWDTISAGGGDNGSSASYEIKDTAGNAGAGVGSSASYSGQAGYRADYIVHSDGGGSGGPRPPPEPEDVCDVDVTGPVISGVSTSAISTTSATISWTTDEAAPGHVDYGTTTSYADGTESETDETSHTVTLSSLSASTTYYFQVEATDTCENLTTSSGYSFTTITTDTAPSNVTSFTATPGDSYVSLSWTSPTDSDFAGTLIIFCLNDFPSGYTDADCATLYNGTGVSYTHGGLTNGTTYYYGAFTYDSGGNYASGALAAAIPTAEETIEEEPTEEEPIEEEPIEEIGEETGEGETEGEETGGTGEEGTTGCGDAVCAATEDSFSCPSDCPSIAIPGTTVSGDELIPFSDVSVISDDGTITLDLSETAGVSVLPGTDVSFILDKENIDKEVSEVVLTLGADTYLLQDSDLSYYTTIAIPEGIANYAAYLIVTYQDDTTQTLDFTLASVSWGLVFEKNDKEKIPVPDATVTLYELIDGDWIIWTPGPGQSNPLSTSDEGGFTWYVENGNYRVTVTKAGYEEASISLEVSNNIVNPEIEIIKEEEKEIVTITTIIEQTTETATTISEAIQTVLASPATQTTATIAAPIITAVAVTSMVVLATSFNLLSFLKYLFTAPILLFARRKRKTYGVVYNAFTKTPIDLALVRLYSLPENKLVRSSVTDRGGRYFFLVQPGKYRIDINKTDYEFPSPTLAEIKDDAIYLDVYHGEEIEVTEKDVVITPNIPVEPIAVEQKKEIGSIKRIRALRALQYWFAFVGVLVSVLVFLVQVSIWTGVVLGVQIIVYLLVRRLAAPRKPKSWGIVYDQKTRRPLGSVIVRIFGHKYHKLLETGITDNRGRYTFLLGPNEYSSTFEKRGYDTATIQPIDYSREKEVKEWAEDVTLSPKENPAPTNEETK